MKGYSGLYVKKTGDTMSGDLNIKSPEEDYYTSLRLKSNNEDNGVTIEWNGNSNRRRVNFYNFPTSDSAYAEAYQFPVNTLDPTTATEHKYYYIVTTKELYKVFPVGSCYVMSTRTDPATILGGGTWELQHKSFTSSATNGSSFFTVNSTNATFTSCYVKRNSSVIQIRLSIKPKVSFADTTVQIGTLNFDKIGLTGLNATQYILGSSDGGGGISEATLNYETGVLNHLDTVHRTGSGTAITSTEYDIVYDFTINATQGSMLDSFCNQFIYKRTA